MSERIKFRYWDRFNAEMVYSEGIKLSAFFSCFERAKEAENNPVLMQWTGLTDKNGKDIYEGDVVDACSREQYESVAGIVLFDEGEFLVETTSSNWPLASVVVLTRFEVKGNIHENPTLLEVNNEG